MATSKTPTVLVADDEEVIRHVFKGMLTREGIEVVTAANGVEALERFAEVRPDLVLLDIVMPEMTGLEVCERLKSDPEDRLTPIILVTASSAVENRMQGLKAGADDFLSKPIDRLELIARVRSLLRIKGYIDELERAECVVFALARSIEGKDACTHGHCERMSEYASRLGAAMGLSDPQIVALRRAGIVHDIGKVAVPDAILLKPARLTPDERAIINEHPAAGERICSSLKSFSLVLPIIRHHHEKIDGTGYPDGLAGDAIPLTARVLTVVDVFDALTTARPYKKAFPREEALAEMQAEVDRGWWDPEIFQVFKALVHAGEVDLIPALAAT